MENRNYIGWINNRAIRGRDFFTKDDFVKSFSGANEASLTVALSRLVSNGVVVSPWQGFYVIVPTEYKLKGMIPPSYYIDELMRMLGKEYYVSLLSAAAIHGAGHQRAQTFFVTVTGSPLRDGVRNGTKIIFTRTKEIIASQVRQIKTQAGMMNVSSPLMTALDVIFMEHKIGGMSRAAEIIAELEESFEYSERDYDLFKAYPTPVIQRFGYILNLLEAYQFEEWLFQACRKLSIKFRHVPLKAGKNTADGDERDNHWKIIVNTEIDIDEL